MSPIDQAEMVAYDEYRASLCDNCRQLPEERMDPLRAFSVEKDYYCGGCRAIAQVQREHEQINKDNPAALDGWVPFIVSSRKVTADGLEEVDSAR